MSIEFVGAEYWFQPDKIILSNKRVVLCVDRHISKREDNTVYIFMQVEPEVIHHLEASIIELAHLYDYILAFSVNILKACPNAYKYIYGTTWIQESDWNREIIKTYEASTLVGHKQMAEGHIFRQTLYVNQNHLSKNIPIIFYKSAFSSFLPIIGCPRQISSTQNSAKIELFSSQFSIVIENSRQENYFTEKLCDCIITKTIPIYFGCPNIHEFFDISGWIIIDTTNIDEFNNKVSVLTPLYYNNYIDTIEKNYNTVFSYKDFYVNVNNVLRLLPPFVK